MVRFAAVSRTYTAHGHVVKALDQLSFEASRGEFIVLRGPSGCGKSTLLMAAGGMLTPTSGEVTVDGRNLYAMSPGERSRFRARQIGFVFQMFHLLPYLTVRENVLLSAGGNLPKGGRLRVDEWLARFGLESRAGHRPAELSTGERQRVAVARSLIHEPQVVLADEPTGNLDPENAAEVFRHLQSFHRAGGTVLLVTHGTAADPYADRIVHLRAGSVEA